MGLRKVSIVLLLAAGCTAIPLPSPLPPAAGGQPSGPAASTAIEREVHDLVNRHRGRGGLAPLTLDPTLSGLAREHSARMADGTRPFGHDGFEGRAQAARSALGVGRLSENVAMNDFPEAAAAGRAVDGWIGSPDHRRNLEGTGPLSGVGVVRSPSGAWFVTQIYASP